MTDMGWTSYISNIEDSNVRACRENAKRFGVTENPDNCDSADPLCQECPFARECPICGGTCREEMILVAKDTEGERYRRDYFCARCNWQEVGER